jgi:hypothetical protein
VERHPNWEFDKVMSENIQVALIAGVVSMIVTTIGLLSSFFVQKMQSREAEKQIRTEAATKLLALRLEHYPKAFDISEKIQRRKKPQRILPREELLAISGELIEWKTGIVNLILSQETLDCFYELRETLGMGYAEKDAFSFHQVEKIISAKDEFRKSLRRDVGFLYTQFPKLNKQRKK